MNSRRLVNDLGHLVSWSLLGFSTATIVTGVIADAWDLNDFRLHSLAGYAMAIAALLHVALSWKRLIAYARFRTRQLVAWISAAARRTPTLPSGRDRTAQRVRPQRRTLAHRAPAGGHGMVSRRGLLGVAAAGAVGVVAGRGLRQPPAIPHGSDVGVIYHEWSKPGVADALGTLTSWGGKPPLYKRYDGVPFIGLPRTAITSDVSVPDAVQQRRSARSYSGAPLTLDQLAALLRLTGGLRDGDRSRRTAPSSGALYPIEMYPVVHSVDGVEPGVYHYDVERHGLSLLGRGDRRHQVVGLGLDQEFLGVANIVLFLTLIHQRMRFKYRDRSYRYGLLEAGHLGQNLYLTATAMGLGACSVGAFRDDGVNDMLGVDGREEVAVYMLAAGRTAA